MAAEPGWAARWDKAYAQGDPPRGWTTQEWPTPLPAAAQVDEYASQPERVLDALPGA